MVRLKDWLFRNKDVNTATEQPDDADSARTAERAETLITQGNTLEDSGDFEAALARYREASAIAPGLGRAWVNIGNALQLMGRFDEAIAAQQAAVRLEPENAPAHYNLGALFARIGDSMGAEQELREALRLRPAMTDARIMLSDVLERREDLDQAEAELRVAIVHDPLSPNAAHNLGVLLNRRQRPDAAEDTIIDARSRMPDVASLDIDLASLYIATARAREAEPLFRKAMTAPSTALQAAGGLLFSLNCRDDLDANQVFREHAALGKLFEIQGRNETSFPNPADPQRPLRIGYVSGDFRRHPVGLFMRPILSRHDRRMFETHCYANHWADDDITTSLKQLASRWHPIAGRDDASVLDMIRRDKIDILVDLAGYTTDGRLGVFARRGAPVQVSWLGYLNTTGLATMDYRVCDRYTDPSPESEGLHTERLFRLTNSQWCYQPVYAVTPVERPHPESPDAVVFGSFNQYAKLSDTCLALWTSVLKRLPDAQVRVYGVPEGRTRSRFLERIASLGVTPARVSLFGRLDAQAVSRGHCRRRYRARQFSVQRSNHHARYVVDGRSAHRIAGGARDCSRYLQHSLVDGNGRTDRHEPRGLCGPKRRTRARCRAATQAPQSAPIMPRSVAAHGRYRLRQEPGKRLSRNVASVEPAASGRSAEETELPRRRAIPSTLSNRIVLSTSVGRPRLRPIWNGRSSATASPFPSSLTMRRRITTLGPPSASRAT